MMPATLVVVPMKDPRLAKTRLRDTLDAAERTRFARHLFERTLRLLIDLRKEAPGLFDIAVVTGHAGIAKRATALGLRAIAERSGATLNDAVTDAAAAARTEGYKRLCILPADLAAPDPDDVRRLLTQKLEKGVVLCPSRDLGTNALLVSPPDAVPFAYGPGSFRAHHAAAEQAGLAARVLPLESLRWDIDSSADLAELIDTAPALFGQDGEA